MVLNSKTKIAFIGAGKIASSFVPALINEGYNINIIISRDIKSAKKLASKNSIPVYSDNHEHLASFKGVVFLTVPDTSLEKLAEHLSEQKLNFKDIFFVHTSGALDSSVLNTLETKGALIGSMHILQSFPSLKKVKIAGCYSAVESTSPEVLKYLEKLARKLNMNSFIINKEEKVTYHLAAVFASNFINAVLYGSTKLFGSIKNIPADHFRIFEPIITSVLHNIKKDGAAMALSGPVERGDIETIKKHLSMLNQSDNILLKSYTANSLMLTEAAAEKHNTLHKKEFPNKEEIIKLLSKYLY